MTRLPHPRRRLVRGIAATAASAGLVVAGYATMPVSGQTPGSTIAVSPESGPVGTTVTVSGTLPGLDACAAESTFGSWTYIFAPKTFAVSRLGGDGYRGALTIPAEERHHSGDTHTFEGGEEISLRVGCFDGEGNVETDWAAFTVTGPAPTTSTTTSTTTTTSPTTTSTVPEEQTAPAFTPPAEPPTDGEAFSNPTSTVAQGGAVSIDESGFVPGETVTAVLYSTPTVLGTLSADGDGTVTGTVTIPAATPIGAHTLVLFGSETTKTMTVTVTSTSGSSQVAGTPASTAQLPRTGRTSAPLAVLGAALIAGGVALVTGERRRSYQPRHLVR